MALARARHPSNIEADYNLVLSNARRKAISSQRQRDAALDKETVQVPLGDDPEYPLFVGTRLIGCLTIKGVVNGAFYTVTSIKRPGGRCILRDDLTGAMWEGTPEDLSKCTQLRHAITYSKCQGQSLSGSVALWDLTNQHFTRRHLYVGLGRVRHGSLLFING